MSNITYAKNLAIMQLPLGSLEITKTTLADIAEKQAAVICESGDALGHYVRAKLLSLYCDEVIEHIKPEVVAEIQHKGFEHPVITLSTTTVGTKYDYSGSLEWCETDAQIQKLMQKREALQKQMRNNGEAKIASQGVIAPKFALGK